MTLFEKSNALHSTVGLIPLENEWPLYMTNHAPQNGICFVHTYDQNVMYSMVRHNTLVR